LATRRNPEAFAIAMSHEPRIALLIDADNSPADMIIGIAA
jgi:predicted MPP superfamily phosphohydrolase